MKHGEVYLADLNPTRGSEQAGRRPVLVFQNNLINRFTRTVICIPFTTNLRRAQLPSCLLIQAREGGLARDSVLLCHQIRVLDQSRLITRLGQVSDSIMVEVKRVAAFTLGMQTPT
ncbi:MAG: type II toxin-antitoxin system PemK/MazF family toxin [Chloroflexota bacterium]|nr:type II toxin-antitoxin system PemK/MazF family toxin [Chloroflexota bacterium]